MKEAHHAVFQEKPDPFHAAMLAYFNNLLQRSTLQRPDNDVNFNDNHEIDEHNGLGGPHDEQNGHDGPHDDHNKHEEQVQTEND